MKQHKKINPWIHLAVLVFLTSCKVHQDALKTDISIPQKFEAEAPLLAIDSVKKITETPEKWQTFFKDPILVQLIDSALVNNLDMQIAFQKVQQARAGVQYTKGIRLPDLGVNLGAGVRRFGDYTIDGVGNYDTKFSTNLNNKQQLPNPIPDFYVGVYSTWEIDIWGKLKAKKKAAFSRFLAEEQGRNLVITNLISEIAIHYYNLMLLDRKRAIIAENILLQENALQVVGFQRDIGKSNQLAIELISAQVLAAKTLLMEVDQEIIEEENTLNFLLGRYPQPVFRSEFNVMPELTKNELPGIPSDLLGNRPDILTAAYRLKAQNADVKAAKAAFYPNLTLNANLGYQAFRAAFLFESPASIAYNVVGGLVTPLLNRRALKADLMASKASQQEAYLNYEKTILQAFTEVYQLVKLDNNFESRSVVKNEQVALLKQSVETSRTLFSSGRAGYLEIITSQENYLRSQIELLEIYRLKNQNNVHLYKALGGGWK
ncbi:efflux transporter outer membrane subunit [Fluviicola taffensis]|uniref:RND efflux system, outer membrane lipoprotein, NodT family n=1 Tax=Fluviicola taffensis (strain DSM 16823 / NCIMB 13979 / RW262) TaxID=755732 RepID=F2IH18_FLUTR|nr:efflux transporter outer membrane subunit [Fluviicola taffensis]AEA45832.1 RND efflux system, outer membrane lipoprotein, NodT family [Fluviicola taffensis DSM 16823]